MNIIGQQVKHSTFGIGIIKEFRGEYIVVSFDIGEKLFGFPNVFNLFLTTDNEDLNTYISSLLEEIQKAKN